MKWAAGFETIDKEGKNKSGYTKPYFMVMCDGGAMAGI